MDKHWTWTDIGQSLDPLQIQHLSKFCPSPKYVQDMSNKISSPKAGFNCGQLVVKLWTWTDIGQSLDLQKSNDCPNFVHIHKMSRKCPTVVEDGELQPQAPDPYEGPGGALFCRLHRRK